MAEHYDAHFVWPSTNASKVIVTGTFDNWSSSVTLSRAKDGFEAHVPLPWDTKVLYKFVVDGRWVTAEGSPTETEGFNVNNVLHTPSRPAGVELASAVAIGPTPGAGAFRPQVAAPVEAPAAAASAINAVADSVQAGVASVLQAAHTFAGGFVDPVSPMTPGPASPHANGLVATAAAAVPSADPIAAKGQALLDAAKDMVNGALAQAPAQDELATKALAVANDAKARASAAIASVQQAVAPAAQAAAPAAVAEKAKEVAAAAPKAADFVKPVTTPPAKPMPVLPLGVPLEKAAEAVGSSVPAALPIDGASTTEPTAGASTHAPIKLAASKPSPAADQVPIVTTSNQLPKAAAPTVDAEAAPTPARAAAPEPFVLPPTQVLQEMPPPPGKTETPAPAPASPGPKEMPIVSLGAPFDKASEAAGSSAAGASTHAPVNLSSPKTETPAATREIPPPPSKTEAPASSPAKEMPIVPLGVPLEKASPVDGASTAEPAAGASTHAPINLASSKPSPPADQVPPVTTPKAPAPPVDAETAPAPARAAAPEPFVLPPTQAPQAIPPPPSKTEASAPAPASPGPKEMPIVSLGVPVEGTSPTEPAAGASTHAPVNLSGPKPSSPAAAPDSSEPPITTTTNQLPVTAAPTSDAAAPDLAKEEAAPVPAKALEAPSTPPRNGTAPHPTALPPATNGSSAAPAVTSPSKSFQQAFPAADPGTPGSVRSNSSSKLGGSIRKKRESFFGKVKDIFKKGENEGDEKERKKNRRQSSLAS